MHATSLDRGAPSCQLFYESVPDESPESVESCEWLWSFEVPWSPASDDSVESSDSVSLDSVSVDSVSVDSVSLDSVLSLDVEVLWSWATALTHSPWFWSGSSFGHSWAAEETSAPWLSA